MLNDGKSQRVAIIGGSRIPFARAHTAYKNHTNQEMMTNTLIGLVEKFNLHEKILGDVALGAVIKHSKDWNLSRESVIGSGLSLKTPGVDMQRACGTSLEGIIHIANKIALGQIQSGIAGGCDSISDAPIVLQDKFRKVLLSMYRGRSLKEKIGSLIKIRPSYFIPQLPSVVEPQTNLSMGESMELTAKKFNISRIEQDNFAYDSHKKAEAAYKQGFYDDLVTSFGGLSKDNNIRNKEKLQKLDSLTPAFDKKSNQGTLTAGNSTPLTDGAAAVLLASEEWAKEMQLPIQAYITFCKVAAVDFINQDGLLMAPVYAVSNMLNEAKLELQSFDFYEIHEAFAAQALATLKAWEDPTFCKERLGRNKPMGKIEKSKLNMMGGSIAIGHPFAATGARVVSTMSKLLTTKSKSKGLISVCTAGGMGITMIIEAP